MSPERAPMNKSIHYVKETGEKTNIEISLSLYDYQLLNGASLESRENFDRPLPFAELSERDPRRAYQLAKKVLNSLVNLPSTAVTAVSLNDTLIAHQGDSTLSERRALGRTLFETLPDEDITEFDLAVNVFYSDEDRELLGLPEDSKINMVSVHVEPNSYAS